MDSRPPPANRHFFPFLQRKAIGILVNPEDCEVTLNLIQTSAAWQESGIQPNWLLLKPQTLPNVPSVNSCLQQDLGAGRLGLQLSTTTPTSLTSALGDMETDNTEGNVQGMKIEHCPIPVADRPSYRYCWKWSP